MGYFYAEISTIELHVIIHKIHRKLARSVLFCLQSNSNSNSNLLKAEGPGMVTNTATIA